MTATTNMMLHDSDDDRRLAALGAQIAELRSQYGNRHRGSYGAHTRIDTTAEKSQQRETTRAAIAIRRGAVWQVLKLAELENRRSARTRRHDHDDAVRTPKHPDAVRPSVHGAHAREAASGLAGSPDIGLARGSGRDDLVEVDPRDVYQAEIERRRGTGKRILVPRETFLRVYEGRATDEEIARARNRPVGERPGSGSGQADTED